MLANMINREALLPRLRHEVDHALPAEHKSVGEVAPDRKWVSSQSLRLFVLVRQTAEQPPKRPNPIQFFKLYPHVRNKSVPSHLNFK